MALGDRVDWPAAAQQEHTFTHAGLMPPLSGGVKAPYPREKPPSRRGLGHDPGRIPAPKPTP